MLVTLPSVFHRRTQNSYAAHCKRARADRQELDFTLDDLRGLVHDARDCPYCGCLLTEQTFSLDHKVPTSRQGNYALANLIVCCIGCNLAKGTMSHDEFHALMALLATFHPRARRDLLSRLKAGGKVCAGRA